MSEGAIDGESGAYVPCDELASPFPNSPVGVIVGEGVGFVAQGELASPMPADPSGAITGQGVGFVPKECDVEGDPYELTNAWQVVQLDGTPTPPNFDPNGEYQRDAMSLVDPPGPLGWFGRWDQANDPPLQFFENRYFLRFAPVGGTGAEPAIRYRVRALIQAIASTTQDFAWEVRGWDWEADAVSGPMWNEGELVGSGTFLLGETPLIQFEFLANHPQRCWIGFRNVSLTGDWANNMTGGDMTITERTRETGGDSLIRCLHGYSTSWDCTPIYARP